MASGLESYVNPMNSIFSHPSAITPTYHLHKSIFFDIVLDTVSIITSDGRNFIGTLKGFDQTINLILDDSHERVYSTQSGVEQIVLGLHIIRGDNVAVVGEMDEDLDSRLDLGNIRAEPLTAVTH